MLGGCIALLVTGNPAPGGKKRRDGAGVKGLMGNQCCGSTDLGFWVEVLARATAGTVFDGARVRVCVWTLR